MEIHFTDYIMACVYILQYLDKKNGSLEIISGILDGSNTNIGIYWIKIDFRAPLKKNLDNFLFFCYYIYNNIVIINIH